MRVLWIIGAGASKHLDLPLLVGFPEFIRQIKDHPDNCADADLQDLCRRTLALLPTAGNNIEELLKRHPFSHDDSSTGSVIRRCIWRTFNLRHHAVFTKRDIPYKYQHYGYLLACMESGDVIVSMNYDTAIERTIENANRPSHDHRRQPRLREDTLAYVGTMRLSLSPSAIFEGGHTYGDGDTRVALIKPHGSLNWTLIADRLNVADTSGGHNPFLVYPDPTKSELTGEIGEHLIGAAVGALHGCDAVVIIGYSCPDSDRSDHPFVRPLIEQLPNKLGMLIDPSPSAILHGVMNLGADGLLHMTFQRAFSDAEVRRVAERLRRTPHLTIS